MWNRPVNNHKSEFNLKNFKENLKNWHNSQAVLPKIKEEEPSKYTYFTMVSQSKKSAPKYTFNKSQTSKSLDKRDKGDSPKQKNSLYSPVSSLVENHANLAKKEQLNKQIAQLSFGLPNHLNKPQSNQMFQTPQMNNENHRYSILKKPSLRQMKIVPVNSVKLLNPLPLSKIQKDQSQILSQISIHDSHKKLDFKLNSLSKKKSQISERLNMKMNNLNQKKNLEEIEPMYMNNLQSLPDLQKMEKNKVYKDLQKIVQELNALHKQEIQME